MPDIDWNRQKWGKYSWGNRGEEWSVAWGGPDEQWSSILYPRLFPLLPARTIVEIAPGYGRWTNYLRTHCERLTAYDLNDNCVRFCTDRFEQEVASGLFTFHLNDGLTLPHTPDNSTDLVFSFDSLVHVEQDVIYAYLQEIHRILSRDGHAFLHHSNLADQYPSWKKEGSLGRGVNVGASTVRDAAKKARLQTLLQEAISWQSTGLRDCITLLRKTDRVIEPVLISNEGFWPNSAEIKRTIAPWHQVVR